MKSYRLYLSTGQTMVVKMRDATGNIVGAKGLSK